MEEFKELAKEYAEKYVDRFKKVAEIAFIDGATAVEIELEEFKQLVGTMLRYQKELHLQRLTNKRDGEKIQELTYHLREVTKKVESYLRED